MDVKITPGPLRGAITPPPSKSQAHRLIIAAALAAGESGYADIEGGEWFAPAVAEMTEKGIMTGAMVITSWSFIY